MLFRVSGKFNDGRSLSTRLDAVSAILAITAVVAGIKSAGGNPDTVTEIRAVPMAAKPGQAVHIGEARAPRAKKTPKPAATPTKR